MYLSDIHNKHIGETCIILGNGPSLTKFDALAAKAFGIPIIGTNRIYLSEKIHPHYYVSVNDLVIEQFADEIANIDYGWLKFLPVRMKKHFDPKHPEYNRIVWINTDKKIPEFQKVPGPMWEGFTVTYVAMQLAYIMGFERCYLYGVDHYFPHSGEPNLQVRSAGPDPNHFHPNYFGKGVEWNYPDLDMSELAYSLAKIAWNDDKRHIMNATHHTALKTFPLVHPRKPFHKNKKKVSAIVSAYYAEEFLERCLFNLMDQTMYQGNELEIVVVYQKGSPEEEILSSFGDDIVRVPTVSRYVEGKGEVPATIYEAWNLGIEASTGEFITNANCDDLRHPKSIETLAMILHANPHIDLAYHDQYITWDREMTYEKFLAKERTDPQDQIVGGRQKPYDGQFHWGSYSKERLITGCFFGPQPMWRRNLHQKHGMFNPEMKSAGDYDFWLRIAKEDNAFYLREPLGLYLAREDGMELKDPLLSTQETLQAFMNNTAHRIGADALVSDLVRLQIGTEFITTTPDGIYGLAEYLRNQVSVLKLAEDERMP